MIPAVAFAAPVKGYFFQEDDLGEGKFVLAVQETDGSWHALKAEPGSATSQTRPKIFITQSQEVTVENGMITDPDETLVWTSSITGTSGGNSTYQLVAYENGYLYFSSSDKLKYQSDGYRDIHVEDQKLYIDTSEDRDPGTPDTTVVLSYNASTHEFSVKSGDNKDRADVLAKGAAVTFFKLPASEAEAIAKAKENALRAIDEATCEDKTLVAQAKQAVSDAISVEAVINALRDFETDAAAAAEALEALRAAKENALREVKEANCNDAALVDEYTKKINGAKTPKEVEDILAKFAEAAKGGTTPTPTDDKAAVDKEKDTATADVNKAIAADNLKNYDADEQKAIKDAVAAYIIKINSATTVTEIKNLVNAFNAEIKALPTAAQKAAIAKIQVKMKKIKVGKKKMTVKWTPKKANFDGYEISYQIKGKKKAKKVTVKKATASKKVIKKLKKGKKYKVKVRGYKLFGTKKDIKVYGRWSKAKTSKKIK